MAISRADIQRSHIPAGYRCELHIAALLLSAAAPVAASLALLHDVRAVDAAGALVAFLLANGGEYALHRWPFHHPMPGGREVYRRHTTMHHAFFTHETMPIDGARDLMWVLLPPWGFLAVLLAVSPLVVLLAWLRLNVACTFLITLAAYYVVYEALHTIAHLPRLPRALAALTRHHALHHDPALMQRYNFNFAFPVFDVLLGTRRRDPR